MPRISSFYGIVIWMFHEDHNPPHFHATYAGHKVRMTIDTLQAMNEGFPPAQLRLVKKWAQLHKDELEENWQRAHDERPLAKIEPLK